MTAVPPDVGELRRLEAGCTPGPWAQTCMGSEGYHVHEQAASEGKRRKRIALCTWEAWETDKTNAEFIAALRNSARWLLGQAETLAKVRELCENPEVVSYPNSTACFKAIALDDILRALEGAPDATG